MPIPYPNVGIVIQSMLRRSDEDIDTALLADDLPVAAYSDPGFVEFLKAPRDR